MRDGWIKTTLGETCKNGLFTDGDWVESKDQDPEGDYRLLQLADIGDGIFLNKSDRWMNKEQFNRLGCTKLEINDVLIARMPDPIGRACLFPIGLPESATVVDVAIVRTGNEILQRILALIVNSQEFRNEAVSLLTGTTRQRISRGNLSNISFWLPPLSEQKRIIDLISSVDSYVEALQQQLESAKKSRNAVLNEMLTTGGDDWVETSLGEIAYWGSGGTPKADTAEYYGGPIPWCVIGDLTEGAVWETEKAISQLGLKNSSAKIVDPGSVLLAMYGASIGRTGISAIPMATNQAIAFAKCKDEDILPMYLLLYLQTQKSKFIEMGQGAAQPNISQTIIKSWPISLPPISHQKKVIERIESFSKLIKNTDLLVNETKKLRSSLIGDLLSGSHEIPASYDKVLGAA